jgi:hypothetical protein
MGLFAHASVASFSLQDVVLPFIGTLTNYFRERNSLKRLSLSTFTPTRIFSFLYRCALSSLAFLAICVVAGVNARDLAAGGRVDNLVFWVQNSLRQFSDLNHQ